MPKRDLRTSYEMGAGYFRVGNNILLAHSPTETPTYTKLHIKLNSSLQPTLQVASAAGMQRSKPITQKTGRRRRDANDARWGGRETGLRVQTTFENLKKTIAIHFAVFRILLLV